LPENIINVITVLILAQFL